MRVTKQGGTVQEPATVSPEASVGPYTTVRDFAQVFRGVTISGSEERPSLVNENACVFGGTIASSIVSCSVRVAGEPLIVHSVVCGALVAEGAQITNAGLFHFSEAWGDCQISNCIVEEQARIYGTAVLDGSERHFTVSGRSRIDRGIWTRAPRTLALDADDYLTESVGGVMVNCAFRDHATWLKIGRRVGKFRGWSPEKIDLALETIRSWQSES